MEGDITVEFSITGRKGRIIQREDFNYPAGTSEEVIQKDFEEWKERIYEEISHEWRYLNIPES